MAPTFDSCCSPSFLVAVSGKGKTVEAVSASEITPGWAVHGGTLGPEEFSVTALRPILLNLGS